MKSEIHLLEYMNFRGDKKTMGTVCGLEETTYGYVGSFIRTTAKLHNPQSDDLEPTCETCILVWWSDKANTSSS